MIAERSSWPSRPSLLDVCLTVYALLGEEVDTLLAGGTAEPCTVPWLAPIVPIKKQDGSIRLCVDCCCLNTMTMPLVDDIINQTGEAQFLSKIDFLKGFMRYPIMQMI